MSARFSSADDAETPWWRPERHADRRPALLARARITSALRAYLEAQGFLMVDVPGLQVSPGNETHLHAFSTMMIGEDGTSRVMHLHTSPEFTLKKLLAAGETRIASLGHVWRNRERSARHHPEFTMLEWYRKDEPYDAVIADTVALIRLAAETAGTTLLRYKGQEADVTLPPERIGVVEAFRQHAGIDLFETMDASGATDGRALAAQMAKVGMKVPKEENWSLLFSLILTEKVEPKLGMGRITILDRYPAAEAALARRVPGDARLAERFEVYGAGVELANGFGELTDPDEQRRRFEAEMAEKQRLYGETYPLDEDLLAALPLIGEASGVALGFDRLVMLAVGAPSIEHVLWAPVAGGRG